MTIKIPMNNWSVMLRRPLPIGYVGENNVETIHIDIPDATATYQLYIEPKYEGNAYWLPFDSDGNLEVTQSDFQKSGMYNGQIVATWSDESVKKSNIFAILIDKSICPVASQEDIDGFTKTLAEYAKQVEDCKTTAETVTAEAKAVAEEAKEASKEARTASEEAQTATATAKKVAEEAQTATATAKAEAETAKAIADEIQAKADSGAFNGKDGAKGEKGDTGATGAQGTQGEKGEKGDTGADGFSPTASVSQSGTNTTISITDKDGTTKATIIQPNDTWELIYETTLTEDTTSLTINTDLTGSAFELKQFVYTIYTPKASTKSNIRHVIEFSDGISTAQIVTDSVRSTAQTMTGFRFDGLMLTRINASQQLVLSQPTTNCVYLDKTMISTTISNGIPSGTEIKLYGIRA